MSELLTMADLVRKFKRSKRTLHRWIKAGQFPKPKLKIVGSPYWDVNEIEKAINYRAQIKGEIV